MTLSPIYGNVLRYSVEVPWIALTGRLIFYPYFFLNASAMYGTKRLRKLPVSLVMWNPLIIQKFTDLSYLSHVTGEIFEKLHQTLAPLYRVRCVKLRGPILTPFTAFSERLTGATESC